MATSPLPFVSFEEYLALEETAQSRSEFYRGEILAMAGGTLSHSRIVANLNFHLRLQLQGGPCEVLTENLLFETARDGLIAYPDVLVFCGPIQMKDNGQRVSQNPKVVVEVLSPSTEAYDRGTKAREYWRCPSVQQYLVISQDQPLVEVQTRASQNKVTVEWFSGLDAICPIESLGLQLPLASIYERLTF
jgi:Uma2 family endonuclease